MVSYFVFFEMILVLRCCFGKNVISKWNLKKRVSYFAHFGIHFTYCWYIYGHGDKILKLSLTNIIKCSDFNMLTKLKQHCQLLRDVVVLGVILDWLVELSPIRLVSNVRISVDIRLVPHLALTDNTKWRCLHKSLSCQIVIYCNMYVPDFVLFSISFLFISWCIYLYIIIWI